MGRIFLQFRRTCSSQVATIIVDCKKGKISNIITHVDKKVSCCFTPKQKDLFRSLLQGAGQAVTDLGPKIIMPGKIKLKVARPNRHKHVVARQQKECLGGSKAGNLSSCLRRCNNTRRLLDDAHNSS
jgi:hypothetical protein